MGTILLYPLLVLNIMLYNHYLNDYDCLQLIIVLMKSIILGKLLYGMLFFSCHSLHDYLIA